MGKRQPQITLKTEERNLLLELARGGKFVAKSVVAPPAAEPVRHYFRTKSNGVTATLLQRRCDHVTPFHLSRSRQATVSPMKGRVLTP
jgi:hypothetical protein